ncbi:radical SAM/SPASM domain-containing protein [Candidatus Enterococcus clewellii]|uniref:Anaerobic sulfatase maturase n=1 Tax=Candidatus Enterococcus clewellii TaxID=1834193 RepID=A0A242KDZ7_9ENTE|nr:anaerobic sulfatase maturase [Enterococcus sp. 9E7_DIV0242]
MKHLSVLIKPASALCNIRCSYCFYADVSSMREVRSFGRMLPETAEQMLASIYKELEDGDQLTLAFQGGEPTIAGLAYFEHIISLTEIQEKSVAVHYTIQTNGMLIDEKWCAFFKNHDFLVGLSIDGHPLYHDMNRLDSKGRGTFRRVLETKRLFDTYEIDYNVLCVLTNPLAKEAKKVFQFIKDENIQYIQFIPCLASLDETEKDSYALTPKRFANFYQQLLKLWLRELKEGNYISIKLFDDLINLLVKRTVSACGMLGNCQIQYVIEADGSVYPCDFYVLDEYRLGYIQEQTLRELFEQKRSREFLCSKEKLSSYCESCPFFKACRGGCKRMKEVVYVDREETFCGYQAVLKSFVPKIETILQLLEGDH